MKSFKFSPNAKIEKFLNEISSDDVFAFEPAKPRRKREPRRTITLTPEVYKLLTDYFERHKESFVRRGLDLNGIANNKLACLPTAEDEAEFDVLLASSKARKEAEAVGNLFSIQSTQYVN